ncbi:tumor necrosis factor receptor superfamily member 14, partial [Carlito syrichta]|uniref:Tumor necrosis factor receptor superfamily member 14 n=1 Tax=Carlito syrichta TaxID=1868482 RepID=A0A3Q0E6I7_CARSF
VLCLFLLGSPHPTLALPSCKEEEYPSGNGCCPKCSPGFHVKQACGELTGTVCVPCILGTFITHHNGLSKCLPCRVCDLDMGLVASRNCSTTENTVCGCRPGHFCDLEDEGQCAVCRPHATSTPGPGTVGGRCSGPMTAGGPGPSGELPAWLITIIAVVSILAPVIIVYTLWKRMASQGDMVVETTSVQQKRCKAEDEAVVLEALQARPA